MMKSILSKNMSLAAAFVAGMFYLAACSGVSKAVADAVVAAATVSFDNAGTGLSAVNVQEALKEVANDTGCNDTAHQIIGTWKGNALNKEDGTLNIIEQPTETWTFQADGTYTTTDTYFSSGQYRVVSCDFIILTSTENNDSAMVSQGFKLRENSLVLAMEDATAVTVIHNLTRQ